MLDQLQALLSDAEAAIEADPENDALLGQRTFFEGQLGPRGLNASFVDRLRPRVRSGELPYLQRVAFAVRDDLWEDKFTFGKTPWAAASRASSTAARTGRPSPAWSWRSAGSPSARTTAGKGGRAQEGVFRCDRVGGGDVVGDIVGGIRRPPSSAAAGTKAFESSSLALTSSLSVP